jgi:hypothetical protein
MSERIRCRIGDIVRCGRAIAVTTPVEPTTLAQAVREASNSDARVAVTADDPGPAHEYVGCIRPSMGLRTRTALAAAARSRGLETPHDAALAEARERLATLDSKGATGSAGTASERAQHREAAAKAATETEQLREAVAAARGRLQARREQGLDPTPATEELAEAIERLSEAETEAAAARQRLDTIRDRTREHRDDREERFRLEERVANLERKARAHLREQVREEYAAALAAVPGVDGLTGADGDGLTESDGDGVTGADGDGVTESDGDSVTESDGDGVTDLWEGDPVTRALGVARVADLSAPVVLSCGRFERPETAADWLDASVIRLPAPR